MNNAFKQNKILKLDANYLIKPDNNNGVVLVFTEDRERTKEDGSKEKFTFKEEFNYPRIAQALRKYVDRELMVEDSIDEMIASADRIYTLIDKIDRTFKQF